MIIVNVKGGLGNQMYQYALYCALKNAGKDVRLALIHFYNAQNGRYKNIPMHGSQFLLEEVFDIDYQVASLEDVKTLGDVQMDFCSRLRRKLGIYKKTYIAENLELHKSLESILKYDNAFLDGYWQNFGYHEDIQNQILKKFRFKNHLKGKNVEILKQITSVNSVSIHVRRNDYLKTTMYEILDREYYQNAIQYIEQKVHDPVFFCFSDDVQWCEKNLTEHGRNIVFVDWNCGSDSYIDMQLMSRCSHNIVANSTFSIWGAWLNTNPEKIVVRPKYYYSAHDMTHEFAWPQNWVIPEKIN